MKKVLFSLEKRWFFLLLIAAITSLLTIAAFGGRYWWGFELATHFRMQYLMILTIIGIIFSMQKKFFWGIITGFLALTNFLIVFPIGHPVQANSDNFSPEGVGLRALLANVDHDNMSHHKFHDLVETENPDVLVLLEINKEWMKTLQKLTPRYPFQTNHLHNQYGLGILSKIPFKKTEIKLLGPADLPAIFVWLEQGLQSFVLVGAHPHSPVGPWDWRARNEYLDQLSLSIAAQNNPVVLLGDLNITPWSPFFQDFLEKAGLKNTKVGFGLYATWPVQFYSLGIPIDHCLITPDVAIHNQHLGPNFGSDHFPVVVDFSLRPSNAEQSVDSHTIYKKHVG